MTNYNSSNTISVIMSIYSEELKWIQEAIDSILNQSYSDFEFIIINDNPSRIENKNLLEQNANKDPRIKHIENSKNIGLTKSLNLAMKTAKGKYIARMDADDISYQNRFQKQLDILDNNEKIIVCGTKIKYFGSNKNKTRTNWLKINNSEIKNRLLFGSCFAHPSVMFRKDVLKNNNISYDESFKHSQDYKLWTDLKDYGDYYNIPEILLDYRLSNQQIGSKHKSSQDNYAYLIRKQNIQNIYIKNGIDNYNYPKEITINDFEYSLQLKNKIKSDDYINLINSYISCSKITPSIFTWLIKNNIIFNSNFNYKTLIRKILRK